MASTPTDDTGDPFTGAASREDVLNLLEDALQEAHRKAKSGRVYDPEAERVRIKWIRAVGYCADQYRKLLRDEDLERMNERLTALEDRRFDP